MHVSAEYSLPARASGGAGELQHISFQGVPGARPGERCVPAPARPAAQEPPSPADAFAGWVLRQAGLEGRTYRSRVFARRVPACLRALKAGSLDSARAILERRPELLMLALDTLLIGVTAFFRDPEVFDDIRNVIVPRLAALGRPPRVWSAACSSGAELYSLAILLDEAGLLTDARLLGTDCRDGAIGASRAGSFAAEAVRSLAPDRVARVFVPIGADRVRVAPRLLAACSWKTANLAHACEPGPWDVVLWRNSAIYMEPAAAAEIYRGITVSLAAQGSLVTGKAERPPARLGYVQVGKCLFQRAGGAGS